ncbi:hypothetical protein [Ornithinimicrobium sp. Y1694]|uniref:hypothetical protein n=1 Tax=Ornithinimicrobium sp. Y1694 TaxID=3418590 RepID=UPI003CEBFF92
MATLEAAPLGRNVRPGVKVRCDLCGVIAPAINYNPLMLGDRVYEWGDCLTCKAIQSADRRLQRMGNR